MTTRHWQFRNSRKAHLRAPGFGAMLLLALLGGPALLSAQDVIQTVSERTITISRGSSALVTRPDTIRTASVGDDQHCGCRAHFRPIS